MTKTQIFLLEELLQKQGLTGDEITQNDPFWGQMIAHAECGADMINDRGADLIKLQTSYLQVYLVLRAIETVYYGEPVTDFPADLAERVLVL